MCNVRFVASCIWAEACYEPLHKQLSIVYVMG